jgi:GNAT superfamily N-acetyltransferase
MRFTSGRVGAVVKALVRPAVVADLAAIAAVHLASARAAFASIGPVERLAAREWAADLAAAETALVAVDGDSSVVGFALVGGCELQFFYTHPLVWGRGFGRALLAAASDALAAAGCTEAFVYTEERNARALAVYRADGWRPDGAVKERSWLGVPIREPRLVKRLSRDRTPRESPR